MTDARRHARRHAPATARNRDPIAAVLRMELPPTGLVLEIASGTGEHCTHFASLFPALDWQPTDPDSLSLASIEAWREAAGRSNIRPPLALEASAPDWPITRANAILCINMVHISPWEATLGLLDGAARLLAPGAPLILYGPYLRDEVETAPSNLAFDADLRLRDPRWGVRHLAAMDMAASDRGLIRTALHEMPANNIMLVYRPQPSP